MRNSQSIVAGDVPQPIARTLRRLIHRVRGVILLRGVSAIIATAVGAVLLIMGIDAGIMIFSQGARWALTLSALAATVAVAVWLLIVPLARTITLTGIARAVETRHPELQERLSSAVELLTSTDIPEIRGSEALIGALAAEATRDAGRVRPRAEFPLRSARPFLLAATGVVLIFASLLVLYPTIVSRLLARAVAPFINLPNISADMLRVSPGDAILAEGQRLEVQVDVARRGVARATLRKVLPDDSERAEPMTALPPSEAGEPRFTLTFPPASESFRYRVHAGDALSRYYNVTVVPPPVVKRFDARFDYPAYTRRKPETQTDIPGDLRAVAGTAVTVMAVMNKPVKTAELRLNGVPARQSEVAITTNPEGETVCQFQIQLKPRMRGRWALAMTDDYGFTNTSTEYLVESLVDKPPTAKIITPEDKKLRLKPSDQLPVAYAMTDDFGVGAAEFVVETDAGKHTRVAIPLPEQDPDASRTTAGQTPLALAKLPLEGAKQFTFRLRATDNLPGDLRGPQEGFSDVVMVELDISAESYAMQVVAAEEEAIRKGLEKVLQELVETKKDSVPLKEGAPKAQELSKDLADRVDRMRDHLGVAKATVGQITPLAIDGTFAGLAPRLGALGSEVDSANDHTGQVKLAEAPAERGTAATEADQHVDRAIELVKELLKQLKEMAEAVQLAQELQELAQREAELAAQTAAPEQPADWQKDQAELAKDVGQLVAETPAAQKAQLAQDQQAARDLANEARQLQQEQQALAKDTGQMGQMEKIDQALQNLAAEQAALARETAGQPAAADQAKPMQQAAAHIESAQLAQAVAEQRAAEAALNQLAKGQQPSGQRPSGEQPSGQQPSGQQPSGEQPSGQQPSGQQPSGEQPSGQQPSGQQPSGEQPSGQQPSGQQPSGEQPSGQQPSGQQPSGQQPSGQQPSGEQPSGQQPSGQQPSGQQPSGQPVTPEQAQAASQLATKQADIRERTEALLAQRSQAAQEMARNQMARIQAEQAQIAREATQLAENVAPTGQQPAQTGEQAAHDAQAAAQQLPSNLPAAAESAASAGQELGALAQELGQMAAQAAGGEQPSGQESGGEQPSGQEAGGEQPSGQQAGGEQPSSGQMGQMAEQAGDLAQRQQQLAREMQALAQANPQQALAAAQQGLADRTGDLQQAASALAERAQAMAPNTANMANEANQALGQAQQAEGQAQEALGSEQPSSAVPSQQSAAQSLGQAAQALSNLGQALAQAAAAMPEPGAPEAAMGEPMAEGYHAATEAAANESGPSAAQAAQSLSQAATQAMGMAQAMGAHPGMTQVPGMIPGQMPSQSKNSKVGIGPVGLSLTAAKLDALGIKLSDWARLPGELRNQILQAAEEGGPEEYRALIKRYFQKVAKRGGASAEEKK